MSFVDGVGPTADGYPADVDGRREGRLRRAMEIGFLIVTQLAAALNGITCVAAARAGNYVVALLYLAITLGLSLAGVLAWYAAVHFKPYRWRDGES